MSLNNGTLADELYDQFLVCRLCSSNYKQPKSLTCMHTFCEACLEMHHDMEEKDRPYRFLMYTRALSCPICRIKTELPAGGIHRLPDNFLVANLGDVINRRKPSTTSPKCDICLSIQRATSKRGGSYSSGADDTDRREKAVIKCLDCVKMLCSTCADLHRRTKVTQMHSLFDVDVQKDVECKIHENEILRFYCEPCETCICVLCAFNEHKDHDVSSLVEGLERHRGSFETLLNTCGTKITRMREQLELTEKCERGYVQAEAHIRDTAIDAISAVRKREKALMAKLRDSVGEKTLKLISEKGTLRENLKNVEATFKVTDVMLKGTSIELLMVKKEIQEKLNNILEHNVEKIPESFQNYLELISTDYYNDIPAIVGAKRAENGYHTDKIIIDTKTSVSSVEVQTEAAELRNAETTTINDLTQTETGQKFVSNPEISKNWDTPIKMVVNFLAGSERELELIQPVEFIVPFEYVTPMTKEEIGEANSEEIIVETNRDQEVDNEIKSSDLLQENGVEKVPSASNSFHTDKILSIGPSITLTDVLDNFESVESNANSKNSNTFIDNKLIVNCGCEITNPITQIPCVPTKSLSPPQMSSTGTGTENPVLADFGTSMSSVLYFDKVTSTPHIILTNKCVSTDNQEMVDKSTCTVIDVAAAYRNMTSSRRLVTVSRGTCTPRAMFPAEIFPPSHVGSGVPQVV